MSDKSELHWTDFISNRVLTLLDRFENRPQTPHEYKELKAEFLKLSNPEKLDLLLLQIVMIRSELPKKEDSDD